MHFQTLFFASAAAMLSFLSCHAAPFGAGQSTPLSPWLTKRAELQYNMLHVRGTPSGAPTFVFKNCPTSAQTNTHIELPAQTKYQAEPKHTSTETLGDEGSYGSVFVSTDPLYPDSVVKVFKDAKVTAKIENEVKALKQIGQLKSWGVWNNKIYIVMSRMPGTPVTKFPLFKTAKGNDKNTVLAAIKVAAAAEIKRINKEKHVMFRDVHRGNLLAEGADVQNIKVKVVDWDLAVFTGPGTKCVISDADIDEFLKDPAIAAAFHYDMS